MRKVNLLILLGLLFSGCSTLSAVYLKKTCGMFLSVDKVNKVSSAYKFMDQSEEIISLGMTKEKVIASWGKPDRYLDLEKNEWLYSTAYHKNATQHVDYEIYFTNNVLRNIDEKPLKKKYECRTNDL